jgi:hypothetical protein
MTKRARQRLLAAAFLHVRVEELIPYLRDVVSNTSVRRTRYLARCPSCDEPTFTFSQGRRGIVSTCTSRCSPEDIAEVIIQRRIEAGEHPENIWGRADRLLRGEQWSP